MSPSHHYAKPSTEKEDKSAIYTVKHCCGKSLNRSCCEHRLRSQISRFHCEIVVITSPCTGVSSTHFSAREIVPCAPYALIKYEVTIAYDYDYPVCADAVKRFLPDGDMNSLQKYVLIADSNLALVF